MGQTVISPAAKGREIKRDDITCKITYCAVGKNTLFLFYISMSMAVKNQ